MARWRLRDPGSFPLYFHTVMQDGEGVDKIVAQRLTEVTIRAIQTDFQIFRFALRSYTGHPTAFWERRLKHRTRIAFHPDKGLWELLLTSRKSVVEEIVKIG